MEKNNVDSAGNSDSSLIVSIINHFGFEMNLQRT